MRVHAALRIRPEVLEDAAHDRFARLVKDVVLDLRRIEADLAEILAQERRDGLSEPHQLHRRREQRAVDGNAAEVPVIGRRVRVDAAQANAAAAAAAGGQSRTVLYVGLGIAGIVGLAVAAKVALK